MNGSSKPESPQVFLVISAADYEGDRIERVSFDRGRALNLRDKLKAANKSEWISYRVEAWREGDTEGEEIKPD